MSVYLVIGTLAYRNHKPGTVFEAKLTPVAEWRALRRKNIRILERSTPALRPGSYTLPSK